MRLVTSVKYLVGFVTASSLAILLSGSAWAAESTSTPVESGSLVSVEAQGNVTVSQTISQVSVSNVTGSSASSDAHQSTTIAEAGTVLVAADAKPSDQTAHASELTTTPSMTVVAQKSDVQKPGGVESVVAVPVQEPVAIPAVTSDASGRTVVYNSQALPVQPVIMSQATTVADLATHIPSAPATTHTPIPVKTTGMLFALTYNLANTIVPALASLLNHTAVDARLSVSAVITLTLIVLIGGFAARLKQSGFVTAARSDVADGHLNFATPAGMGYVSLRLQARNPFFMVSDTKSLEGNRS